MWYCVLSFFFFSSRRRHTRFDCDWSSDVCSSDLAVPGGVAEDVVGGFEVVEVGAERQQTGARPPVGESARGRGPIRPLVERAGHGILDRFLAQLRAESLREQAPHTLQRQAYGPAQYAGPHR